MNDIIKLFCSIDDFCKGFEPEWKNRLIKEGCHKPKRAPGLCMSEIMTIVILFQQSGFRNFKLFYHHLDFHFKNLFPGLPSYNRFLEIQKGVIIPLYCYLFSFMGSCTGISFVDSAPITVCHLKRAFNNKVFKGIAKKGKSSMGWFFGFKLHVIVNDKGELLGFMMTPGNVSDIKAVPSLIQNVHGKLIGDKGYISSKLFNLKSRKLYVCPRSLNAQS